MKNKIFEKCDFDYDKLKKYGFELEENYYRYEKQFFSNRFILEIIVYNDNKYEIKVIEKEFGEEFTNINISSIQGEFISKLREEYENILLDIKNKCCITKAFKYNQSNMISKMIYEQFNNTPEFLWDKFPSYGVYRNKKNKKWYAVIMNISSSKISKKLNSEDIDVINIKIRTDNVQNLLKREGYYPAYHMNKKNWVTIILNDTIDTNEIFELVKQSYTIVDK